MTKIHNNYEDIIRIHKGLMDGNPSRAEVVESIDRNIELMGGFWKFAVAYNAIDKTNCEDFSIDHMTEFNNTFGLKY